MSEISTNDASFYSLTPTSSPTSLIPSTASLASSRDISIASSSSATVKEVQLFFRDCFLIFYSSLSQREAKTKAEKLIIDGVNLYAFPAEALMKIFDPEGRAIYNIINNEYHSYISYSPSPSHQRVLAVWVQPAPTPPVLPAAPAAAPAAVAAPPPGKHA